MLTTRLKLFSLFSLLSGSIAASTQSTKPPSAWPLQSFKSSSLEPPFMNVTKRGQTEPGYLFVGPMDEIRKTGYPTIYSDDGQLVWQGQFMNISAYQPQTLHGEPVLAYWNGADPGHGFGFGVISILNSSYHEIHTVSLPQENGNFFTSYGPQKSYIDIHESHITDDGTILVTAVNTTRADLTPVGGPENGWVQDGLFYEIDIESNDVVFSWSSLAHLDEIPMTNVEVELDGKGKSADDPFAYSHLNAVAKYGENYLLSSRYMCSVFLLDKNGHVIWQIHGRKGKDFSLGIGAGFCYQHNARFLYQRENEARMYIHNNENADGTSHNSITTGLVLDLDLKNYKATPARKVWNPNELVFSTSQGSYQNLTNDHVLLYHGSVPLLEEYDENGACVMSARYGEEGLMEGYRGFRGPWVGKPTTKPSVVACGNDDETKVYVSWNGASDVQSWKVYTGSGKENLGVAKTVMKNGFETKITVEGSGSGMVMVQAVGGVNDGTRSEIVSFGEGC